MIRKWLDRKLAAIGGVMAAGDADPAAPAKSRAERFQDPLAGRVAWSSKSRSTSGMRTHKLVARGRDRMKFRATAQILALGLGLTVPPIYVSLCLLPAHGLAVWFWCSLLFCFPLCLIGVLVLRSNLRSTVFCKRSGRFWRGGRRPGEGLAAGSASGSLEGIHALQLLSVDQEGSEAGDRSWVSYELNLVLHGGSRVNVIAHGRRDSLRADAERLAVFLGVPVWDATSDRG